MRAPRSIAAAIERLLDDRRLAARLGAAARGHVAENYALDRLLPRQVELIASLAREKAGSENGLEASIAW